MKKYLLYLGFILLLGGILRFYHLGDIPVGFHRDEAYFGYNAYSILNTGRDMTGNLLPLELKSFLYSPALYSYFSIPFILLFGLSEFSTRFTAALFGTLTIVSVFLLSLALFKKYKNRYFISLVASTFFAISPWSINLSRVATENVVVVFLISMGVYLYKRWVDKNRLLFFVLSIFLFFVSIYVYQGPRIFLPFFLPIMFLTFLYKQKKKFLMSLVIYLIFIILPIVSILLSQNLSTRIRMLSIFNSPTTQLALNERLREDGVIGVNPIIARLFDNKPYSYAQTFIINYSDHFSFRFLFTDQGLPDRYRVSGAGLLYLLDLPFLLIGLVYLFRNDKKVFGFLLGWILIAPIGSALTFDDIPNLQRTFIAFPSYPIISALGFCVLWSFLDSKKYKKFIAISKALISTTVILSFVFYLHAYYVNMIVHRPWYRQEGYKEMISAVNKEVEKTIYKKIVVTSSQTDPSIFFIFYNKLDPYFIQSSFAKVSNRNYGQVGLGKYDFSDEECPLKEVFVTDKTTLITTPFIKGEEGLLYVNSGTCKVPKEGVSVLDKVVRADGTTVFLVERLNQHAKIYKE